MKHNNLFAPILPKLSLHSKEENNSGVVSNESYIGLNVLPIVVVVVVFIGIIVFDQTKETA